MWNLFRTGVLFAVFSCSLQARAQGQLTGQVWSQDKPVEKATVMLGKEFRLTDSLGGFRFLTTAQGRFNLHVSMVGFEPFHRSVSLDSSVKELHIELQPLISSLDAVVVSGTMKPVKRLESPIAVEVYSPQFFKKNPSPSIFEALQNINGVRPQINCSVCNTGDIHINGLEGPYTMVTIDGMPIVSSLSSVYGLFGIPSELIERVEIVKGPASGLYGSEAIGGLINIITKTPERSPRFSATLMSTSWQEHTADLGFRWKIKDRLQSLLGVSYFRYQQPIDRNDDGFTDVTLQHRISLFNKWSLKRKENRAASLGGRFFYEDRWGGDLRWNKSFRGSNRIYGESIETKRWELIGNYQLPVQTKLLFSFSATGHEQDSYYGIVPFRASQRILFGQLLWDMPDLRAHNLLLGFSGRRNYYDDNTTATRDTASGQNIPERYTLPGIFVQDEWKRGNSTLLLGMRYDHHPAHGSIWTPRIAYKWAEDERQVIRLNAGTGFRVVNLFTEDHAALTGARAVEIKGKLNPEKSYNANLNYTRQWGSRSRSLSLDASVWYSYFANQIIADYDTDPNKIIYENLTDHAESKGLTLNLEIGWMQRLKALVGTTLQQVAKVGEESGVKTRQRPVLTENWSGTWSVSYAFPMAGLNIDYTGNMYGPMRLPLISPLDPRKPYSPVWSIQNIQLSKSFSTSFELFAGVKNLLNWTPSKNNPFLIARTHDPFDQKVEYNTDGSVKATAENPYALTFDPSYIYAPNQGIRMFGGMRVKIK